MKKSKVISIPLFICFISIFFREIYCAIIYLYNIAVSRSNKLVLSKILDIKKDTEVFSNSISLRKKEIDKWKNNTFVIGVKIKSFDKSNLFGEIFVNENSDKWVIVLHGYGTSGEIMYYAGLKFYEKGYNVLIPDLRGHGISSGNYIGMGWHDRIDLIYWINEIIKRNKEAEIVLYGVSMGASTVLMATGENLPPNVKYAISDCAFTSAYDIFKHQIKKFHKIPAFPLLDLMGLICKQKNNYSIRKASALKQVKKSIVPTLFIHGDKDNFVPIDMMYQLYENASCFKEKFVVKNAGHATSEMIDNEKYWNKVFEFIK